MASMIWNKDLSKLPSSRLRVLWYRVKRFYRQVPEL